MKHNGTILLIDTYQKYPELVDLALKHRETMMLTVRVGFLLIIMLTLRAIIRSLLDPFSVKLHNQIAELHDKLDESEGTLQVLLEENQDVERKLAECEAQLRTVYEEHDLLNKKLTESEARLRMVDMRYATCLEAAQRFIETKPHVSSLVDRYLCCRQAAQRFINSRPLT